MTDQHDDDAPIVNAPPSVGAQLKTAREAKKLTIGEIAAQLRLTQETIKHIESEQWSELHGRAYARGYFLSYVKFLGLPEHDMLTGFNMTYKVAETEAPSSFGIEQKSFPWLKLIFIAVIAVAMWFAYQQWQRSAELEQQAVESLEPNASFESSVVEPLSTQIDNATSLQQQPISEF